MNHFLVFGSHPRLSLAELRAARPYLSSPLLIGSAVIVEDRAWSGEELMETLGGTVKLGDIVQTIPTQELTSECMVTLLATPPLNRRGVASGGVLNFGLTVFGSKKFSTLPLQLKKELKRRGIASRWVTGKNGAEIAPAAVAKLKLTSEGIDLCLFVIGDATHIGVTTHVQDADAWSFRDYGRPERDELAGMLPPKLARMMVNLATPLLLTKACPPIPTHPRGVGRREEGQRKGVLLDPFCGSGTILMEAALAFPHIRIAGSDIDAKQISDTRKNISWLIHNGILKSSDAQRIETFVADARHLSQKLTPRSIHTVVTEGHLGPPLRGYESRATLEKNVKELTALWRDTLRELHPLLADRARLVLVWPEFKTTNGTARVDLEPLLASLGYKIFDPFEGWNVSRGPLLYHRPGQYVMRRIVLMSPR